MSSDPEQPQCLSNESSSKLGDDLTNQQPPPKSFNFWEYWRQPLITATAAGAFSLMGIYFGSQLSTRSDQIRWEREQQFTLNKELLAKRMELLERSVRIFSELNIADFERFKGANAIAEAQRAVISHQPSQASANAYVESASNLKHLQAEMASLLFLSSIYYGPKTKLAAEELLESISKSDIWWNIDKSKIQKFQNAQYDELKYVFPK